MCTFYNMQIIPRQSQFILKNTMDTNKGVSITVINEINMPKEFILLEKNNVLIPYSSMLLSKAFRTFSINSVVMCQYPLKRNYAYSIFINKEPKIMRFHSISLISKRSNVLIVSNFLTHM